jgi:hypothetical protein
LAVYDNAEKELLPLLDTIGTRPDAAADATLFFANFYIGLYYDSIQDGTMAEAFLGPIFDYPKFKGTDLWRYIPQVLWTSRGNRQVGDGDNI